MDEAGAPRGPGGCGGSREALPHLPSPAVCAPVVRECWRRCPKVHTRSPFTILSMYPPTSTLNLHYSILNIFVYSILFYILYYSIFYTSLYYILFHNLCYSMLYIILYSIFTLFFYQFYLSSIYQPSNNPQLHFCHD